ncbi:tape measure protein [Pediococcus pentosaceus]|uniref:tape measure protein n=1 Tax=Pediococcus pentosaceus TaxID=1255 RepID=UPI0018A170B2|nr:tape measure protein [Pediococcus pentosaceus]MBF7139931.1 tape measure protein [Pediococcus pentosaceus]
MTESYSVTAVLSAVDKNFSSVFKAAKSSMDNIPTSTKNVNSGITSMNSSIGGLVAKAAALAGGAAVMSGAISRFDTLNKYPVVMKALGYSMNDTNKSAKLLSDGIDGLPTSLDEITKSAQDFAPLTGGATAGAKAAIALNNAFLASGASVSDTSRGIQQYSQMLATGKVDLMSWRTLQETMPIALRKTANAFGFTGKSAEQDLYKALQDGSVTMDQLNGKFIELNKGQNGFAVLAKKNSAGIGTSFANLANSAKKGMANMLTAVDTGLQNSGLPKIATMIDSLKVVINNSFAVINSAITSAIPYIANLVKAIGSLASNTIFQALAGGVVAFIAAFKGVTVIVSAMRAVRNALLIGGIIRNLASDTQLLSFAFSNMAAESKIAAAAQKIFNLVAGLNPYVLIIAGIAAVIAALTIFFSKTDKGRAIWKSFVDYLVNIWNTVAPTLAAAWKAISDSFMAAWNTLLPVFQALWSTVVTVFQTAITSVQTALAPLIPIVTQIFNALAPIVLPIIGGILTALVSNFLLVIAQITIAITTITALITAGISIIGAIWTAGWQVISATFSLIWTVISTIASTSMAVIKNIIALALAVITGNWSGAWQAVKNIFSAVWSAIKTIVSAGINFVKSIISAGIGFIRSVWDAGIKALQTIVSSVWNIIKSVFSAGVAFIKSVVHVDLGAAGEAIMNSLLNGLKRAWESVKSFVGGIAGWIKSHKGPISYDRRLLIPHGQAVMLGFNEGLMKQFSNVQSNVSAMAGQVADSMQISMPAIDTTQMDSSLNHLPSLSSASLSGSVNGSVSLEDATVSQQNNALLRRIADKDTNLYMDSDTLVGTTSDKFNGQLGATSNNDERWGW